MTENFTKISKKFADFIRYRQHWVTGSLECDSFKRKIATVLLKLAYYICLKKPFLHRVLVWNLLWRLWTSYYEICKNSAFIEISKIHKSIGLHISYKSIRVDDEQFSFRVWTVSWRFTRALNGKEQLHYCARAKLRGDVTVRRHHC